MAPKKVTEETVHVHEVRNTSAISGAVVGATAGILGGIAGIGTAGLLGAVLGAVGGLVLEHDLLRATARDREASASPPRLTRREEEAAVGIEPPCDDCVDVRDASGGSVEWCARHAKHHVRAHLHHEYPQSFAMGSMLIRPAA